MNWDWLKSIWEHEWLRDWPNRLTLARVLVIPFILFLYPLDFEFTQVFCTFLFIAAAITDILDGMIARHLHLESSLGALLDPIADKMLSAAALLVLCHARIVPPWMAGFLLCRDIGVSGMRLVAAEQKLTISVSSLGKLKTIFEDVALGCLMPKWETMLGLPLHTIGMICLWVSIGLSGYSAYLYARSFFAHASTLGANPPIS